jgi:glycosyltransferase involved in cell wall biosynthesis
MKDKISVVIPMYNASKYLKKCIDNVINQKYSNLEIILVDDGSTDNCLEICNKYSKIDDRIVVIHKENGGLSSARNAGIEKATGKYITFIDSDDVVEKDYINILYDGIKKYKTKMCIGGLKTVYENGKVVDNSLKKTYKLSKMETFKKMLYTDGVSISAWSKLYDISLFKNVEYTVGRLFEDTSTTYKLIDQCDNISISDYPIYNYYIRKLSITSSKFNIKKLDWIISAIEMTSYLKKKYKELSSACTAYMMYTHIGVLSSLAMNDKDYKKERNEIISYIKANKKKYISDKNVQNNYKLVCRLICFNYFIFKIFLKTYQRFIAKRYE